MSACDVRATFFNFAKSEKFSIFNSFHIYLNFYTKFKTKLNKIAINAHNLSIPDTCYLLRWNSINISCRRRRRRLRINLYLCQKQYPIKLLSFLVKCSFSSQNQLKSSTNSFEKKVLC